MVADKPKLRASWENGQLTMKPVVTPYWQDGKLHVPDEPSPGPITAPEPPITAELLRDMGNQIRGGPVQLTYYPTRTSNPSDPRTAAAGYDAQTRTMRVSWGDGGKAYNYYQVEPQEWQRFKRSASPGKLINRFFNFKPYGPA